MNPTYYAIKHQIKGHYLTDRDLEYAGAYIGGPPALFTNEASAEVRLTRYAYETKTKISQWEIVTVEIAQVFK